jgi:RNA polymerase sigma factor (TIGR02999 family)
MSCDNFLRVSKDVCFRHPSFESKPARLNEMSEEQDVTKVLRELSEGDCDAPARLMPLVYNELRKLSQGYLLAERPDHTLQATALVHEAYIRLVDWENVTWQNRAHFFAVAAQVMRRILVDHARERNALKRGGGATKLSLDQAISFAQEREVDLVALDDALHSLALLDDEQSRIVELRFFGGLTIEETAEALHISPATVKREWTLAKAWLHKTIVRGV